MAYRSINPATGELLKTFTEHGDEQMMNALALVDKAFKTWAARPFSERSKIIATAAQLLLKNKEELARLATTGQQYDCSDARDCLLVHTRYVLTRFARSTR